MTQPSSNTQSQNQSSTQGYQPNPMQNEIPLPYYFQQHENTKTQLTIFTQLSNTAESFQMTMIPNLMGGLSIRSEKTIMVFTETDPGYSVEDFLNSVTAKLILIIGSEPINTSLHQKV